MKHKIWIILSLLFLIGEVNSQSRVGVGIMVGTVNGPCGKVWLNNRTAIDILLSWYLWEQNVFYIHSDFLWHESKLIRVPKGKMPLYYGIGGRLVLFESHRWTYHWRYHYHDERALLGLRLPLGIEYLSARKRWDIFMELALVMDLVPGIYTGLEAGIGGRIYFGR